MKKGKKNEIARQLRIKKRNSHWLQDQKNKQTNKSMNK